MAHNASQQGAFRGHGVCVYLHFGRAWYKHISHSILRPIQFHSALHVSQYVFLMYFLPCVNLLHNMEASTAAHIHNQLAHKLPLSGLFDSPPHVIVHMFTFKRMYKSGTGDPCTHADIDWKQSLPQIRIRICSLWSGSYCLLVGCLPGNLFFNQSSSSKITVKPSLLRTLGIEPNQT